MTSRHVSGRVVVMRWPPRLQRLWYKKEYLWNRRRALLRKGDMVAASKMLVRIMSVRFEMRRFVQQLDRAQFGPIR